LMTKTNIGTELVLTLLSARHGLCMLTWKGVCDLFYRNRCLGC
jgi:hypothetical protein